MMSKQIWFGKRDFSYSSAFWQVIAYFSQKIWSHHDSAGDLRSEFSQVRKLLSEQSATGGYCEIVNNGGNSMQAATVAILSQHDISSFK